MVKKSLVLATFLLVCFATYGFTQSILDIVPRMEPEQFKVFYTENSATIVDVRSQYDYEAGHIPGAILVPLEILNSYLSELRKRPQPIITYCS